MTGFARGVAWFALLAVSACSDDGAASSKADAAGTHVDAGSAGRDAAAAAETEDPLLFDPAHLLEVDIKVDPADWDRLRYEGRELHQILGGCADGLFDYTQFPAALTVDGKSVPDVMLRKKGLLGSLSAVRPSLKIDLGNTLPTERPLGAKRMTLNNDRQDPSHTHQCLSYRRFDAAGVPAPRCNLAHVVVNGKDLGIYSHVEDPKKPFLRRAFGDDSGRLFEGQNSDLADGFIDRFELKTDGVADDRSALQAVASALLVDDDVLLDTLDAVLPLDDFLKFWAMEGLLGHWDGYSGDLNNFYVYEAPNSGLRFIPWGTDGAFSTEHPFLPNDIPASLYAWSHVSNRLYAHPEGRRRYVKTLRTLLDTVWDETTLLTEVDDVAALVGSEADASELDKMRGFIRGRRTMLEAELVGDGPDWKVPPRDPPVCSDTSTPISATFKTTWGTIADALPGAGNTLQVQVAGQDVAFDVVVARAGMFSQPNKGVPSQPAVRIVGGLADGRVVVAQINFGPAPFAVGTTRLHGTETAGFVAVGTPPDVKGIGLIGDGKIVLDQASMVEGEPVIGHFEATLVPLAASVFEP